MLTSGPHSLQSFYKSHSRGRATAQIFPDFAQNHEICMRKLNFFRISTSVTVYVFMFQTYCVIFSENIVFFLAQKLKTKVLTAQKIYF